MVHAIRLAGITDGGQLSVSGQSRLSMAVEGLQTCPLKGVSLPAKRGQ